ncbi:MAG: tRNA (N(6)-L-threonylcarbamoyladenosine(37)-C(2))-methylthiotransferase MtaB [Bacteroidetes bacterium]|nr:tRNA (N(6)-L-threonylcarbamoyladenosine(37)-C(2))-methylthiotransferase MtaB [Bacteroidota bacterium]
MDKMRIAFHTFGCKLNFSETSTIARDLPQDQFEIVDFHANADIYIIHSCAVTAAAEKKCRQTIRHIKRIHPAASVIVIGCFAQLRPDELADMDEVDLLLGSDNKFKLKEFLTSAPTLKHGEVHINDIMQVKTFTPSYSLSDRTRSFLKIQDGCDYFCSYCAIPLARGRSRSATISDTVKITGLIAANDIKEIVLTGVNIGDFGKNQNETFYGLLKELDKTDGIERIRISSIEPDLLSSEIINFVAGSEKIMPHFHIPLQSGSNRILKAMHRKYSKELFADKVNEIKSIMPDCCIAADVIVGFPGESEEYYRETYSFIDSLDISYVHVFSYSERPNTYSSKVEGKVHPSVIKDRSKRLHELSQKKKMTFYENNRNRISKVLFESDPNKNHLFGFTENYIHVKAPFKTELINQIITLILNKMDDEGNYLFNFEKSL